MRWKDHLRRVGREGKCKGEGGGLESGHGMEERWKAE
jgi:hypothetical protein